MADIALSDVLKKALEIGRNLVVEEGSRFYWLREDINWIQGEMRYIQAYLEDAEGKQSESRGVTNWMNDIRDLAYDVEDIMDTFLRGTASQRRKGFRVAFRVSLAKLLSTDVDCHAVSIVGMPGVGKATLAKKVYGSV
ncbi:hypothetical protein F0562_001797 [Nyssa sinensis]|uniref:Rx N-terminal domain-containing protein n=1 Tax=Nyssa sinensis TaxID=561372 RepID=A0A5J5C409_9ASTE|nr:hypothetical protein F0562_001797 [Nyssa sinensis]